MKVILLVRVLEEAAVSLGDYAAGIGEDNSSLAVTVYGLVRARK